MIICNDEKKEIVYQSAFTRGPDLPTDAFKLQLKVRLVFLEPTRRLKCSISGIGSAVGVMRICFRI